MTSFWIKTLSAAALAAALSASPVLAQSGRTATIALSVNVNTFDPHMTGSFGSDMSLLSHIYPSLVIRSADLKLAPALAKSWTLVNDTTWRFDLVEGAKFVNDEPLDAATVKWNLDRVRDPKVNARIKSWFDLVKEVRVIDARTVEVETSAPFPAFVDQLSMFFLLPPQWAASHNPATETMSGSRYRMTENVPGDHITLAANPGGWQGKPDFDTVVFKTIPEPASRIAALLAGEVDLVTGIPTSELARVKASKNAIAGSVQSTRNVFIKFNTQKAPLDNKLVRQAMNYAIDKDAIRDSIFDGQAYIEPCQILTPSYFGFNPDLKPYPYDVKKAQALLKESGIDLKQVIEMDIPVATYIQGQEVAQAVAAMLGDAGLKVKMNEMDFGAYMNKYLRSRTLAQTSLLTHGWPTLDADGQLTLLAPGNQYAYWDDAAFGKALEAGRSTMDKDKRLAAYKDATKIMCEEAPVLFLYAQPTTYGVSRRVTWQARGDDWVRSFDMKPAQ
ncbi:peptide/nickel transport system substrate-binding protein [Bosea sp. OK403]|uniref:ABC transporter substrate-binding protein n=1 Tax=Bosea sp. OK403 TaxID=1855286 RepID=UPI0008EE6FA1|nr:ABC transporter substrate-binding protein [Bosea sp. OK403]SFI49564.1 peptide/nickel transport system substrate-binding protein [Bosea sp. OK403]